MAPLIDNDIPDDLVQSLWKWHLPREQYRHQNGKPPFIGKHHSKLGCAFHELSDCLFD